MKADDRNRGAVDVEQALARVRPRWDELRTERNLAAVVERLHGGRRRPPRWLRLSHAAR